MLLPILQIQFHRIKKLQIYQEGCNQSNKKEFKTWINQKPANLSSTPIWRLNQSVGHKHRRFKILIRVDKAKLVKIYHQHMLISKYRYTLWFKTRSTKLKIRKMSVSKPYLACLAPRKRIQINKITNLDQAETPTGRPLAMLSVLMSTHQVQRTPWNQAIR